MERLDFQAFGRYVFGTSGNEANIQHYLVPYRLSTDPQIHDLEWPFYVKFPPFRTALSVIWLLTYRTAYL